MSSFGEYLSREREFRGVTLEEIAKSSNVNIRYLRALENDDHDDLPAEVFVKGFLKSYAECTGMNINEVLLTYDEFIAAQRSGRDSSDLVVETPKNISRKLSTFLAIVTFITISFFLVYYYIGKSKEVKSSSIVEKKIDQEEKTKNEITENTSIILKDESQKSEDLPDTADDFPVDVQEEKTTDNDTSLPPVEIQEAVEMKTAIERETKVGDILVLTVEADEDAWIKLTIDDNNEENEAKEALLKAGETARWKAKEKFIVTLGNKAGTHMQLNGKYILLPESSSNILRDYVITLDNIKSEEPSLENSDSQ